MPIHLSDISTRSPKEFDKDETKKKLVSILDELDELQNLLYANQKYSVLVIVQGMDASGKDGAVKNVFGTLNPLGVLAKSFKSPTEEELSYDFLWRIHKNVPAKGMIQIFNRSQYEDVLIARVHKWIDDEMAYKRMEAINDFERLLQEHNETVILKFYLHTSKEKQAERLNERLTDERKHWKADMKDFEEAKLWDIYMKMYEDCFEKCNAVPWTIVPADQNWYKEYVIASTLLEKLQNLKMKYPELKKE